MANNVTVKQVGSSVTSTVSDARTIEDALRLAGLSAARGTVTRNGSNAQRSDFLQHGDLIMLVPSVKGGATITVRVMRTGGTPRTLNLASSATVADAVRESNIESGGCTTRLNGQDANGGEALRDGDNIILVAKVHGGC